MLPPTPPLVRRARRISVAVVLAAAWLVPGVADAHETLRRSVPAKDAVLAAAPDAIRLTFSSGVELALTRVVLLWADSIEVRLGPLARGGDSASVVVAAIAGPLRAGAYTVHWQTGGADGHPVQGRFGFTIASGASGLASVDGAGPPGAPATPGAGASADAAGDPSFDTQSVPYVLVRWLTFLAVLAVIGLASFHHLVLGQVRRVGGDEDGRIAGRADVWGAGLAGALGVALLALAAARLAAQTLAVSAGPAGADGALIAAMLRTTSWGWGWLLQVVGALALVAGAALARRGIGAGWGIVAAAAVTLAATPALSGHAAGSASLAPLVIAVDVAHVLAAGGWLGTLLALVAIGLPAALALGPEARGRAAAVLFRTFSPIALGFAALLLVTGVVSTWVQLGSLALLWESAYGRTLLVKLAILSLVVATGAYNWRRVIPALGSDGAATRIRRSALVELAVAAAVVLVTAVLVATPPPVEAVASVR